MNENVYDSLWINLAYNMIIHFPDSIREYFMKSDRGY